MWCDIVIILSLVCHITSRSHQPDHPQQQHGHPQHGEEEGSGCPFAKHQHYFDYLDVDDEDYQEGSSMEYDRDKDDLFVRRGPPVFTDSMEEEKTLEHTEHENNNLKNISEAVSTDVHHKVDVNIIPENLVIENETHGNLNGRFVISSTGQGTVIDLFFDETEDSSSDDDEESLKIVPQVFSPENNAQQMNRNLIVIFFPLLLM